MEQRPGDHRVGPGWSALILLVAVGVFISVTSATFAGVFRSYVTVTVSAERSGIIMEPNAKVKMRGVEVGRVDRISNTADGALLELHIQPDQLRLIPANVEPRIDVTTAFGGHGDRHVGAEHPGEGRRGDRDEYSDGDEQNQRGPPRSDAMISWSLFHRANRPS
ncbi:hypothetical protein BST26_16125 [Mycolicibacterium insubricum]|uniref:Mce/MlaD domain-containing protein n=1 Tax=Mycolicibacterium insubricum TaxID=444597 RepID=A0A1X0D3Y4_9MYCO|nr:MlaD family protein [Mycolicibacterium insubricum]ORA67101.1 hypothetical protein BST26_16125 [Mycolicibacterium insubricum]